MIVKSLVKWYWSDSHFNKYTFFTNKKSSNSKLTRVEMIVQVSHFVGNGSPTPFVAFVGDRSVSRVVIVETSYPQTHILKSGWGHTGLRLHPERRSEGCDEKCCRQAAEHQTSDRKHSRPFHHFACRRTFQLLRCCCRLFGVSSGLPVVSGRVHVWHAVTCRGGIGCATPMRKCL